MSLPADPSRIRLPGALLVGALCLALPAAAGTWSFPLSTGYDLYIHDYYLAETDTIEVIQELNFTASANGASGYGDRHRWYFRAGASGGTELFREALDTGFRLRTERRQEWLRGEAMFLARQFRPDSEYSLSSNNNEGRLLAAVTPWTGEHTALEVRTRGRYVDYDTPSTLEVDYGEASAGLFLRTPNGTDRTWRVGGAWIARDYPDTAQINRNGYILEGEYDQGLLEGTLRAFHRSERRNIQDETARPSAWFHWSELDTAHPTGRAEVILRARSEIWDYDEATGAWYDSWQAGGEFGARWGDPFDTRFETLVTVEHLAAGEEPEAYWQAGFRVGAETLVSRLSGSASIELGQRWYRQEIESTDAFVLAYSDYGYLALWLTGNWMINEHFSIDAMANFEPESHAQRDDDITLGFASLRLVYRP